MGAKIKIVFLFATLAVLLIKAVRSEKDSNEDEVKQDLDNLLEHQQDLRNRIEERLVEGLGYVKIAREEIKSADSCSAVHDSLGKIVTFLREDEEDCSKETHEAICENLCVLLKYDETYKGECKILDTRIGEDVLKMRQVKLDKNDSAVCDLVKEKNGALKKLTRAKNAYQSDIVWSRVVSRKAFNITHNGLAVLKRVDMELKGGQKRPGNLRESARIVEAARDLRDKYNCFQDD
nr:PREDICTED: uncharacterized protein LOC109031100 [Bemisia tabaci]